MATRKEHLSGASSSVGHGRAPTLARPERRALFVRTSDEHAALDDQLRACDWLVEVADEPAAALELIESHSLRVGIVALESAEQLERIQQICGHPGAAGMAWIVLLDRREVEEPAVREFIAARCFDYQTIPPDPQRIAQALGHAEGMGRLTRLTSSTLDGGSGDGCDRLVAQSVAMRRVLCAVDKVAASDLPVLISGESGSGKARVALALHLRSLRARLPFVAMNCGGLSPAQVRSGLFAGRQEAPGEASRRRHGGSKTASGGTILLKNISDLPADTQVILRRYLDEHAVEGASTSRGAEEGVRLVATTDVDLAAAVARGDFRKDLYYRLNALSIQVPPLRERREDLAVLAEHLLAGLRSQPGVRARGFSVDAMRAISQYAWPGNARELANRVGQAALMCECRLISRRDLGLEQRLEPRYLTTLKAARDSAERASIVASLRWSEGNVTRAAQALGVSRNHLYALCEKHGLDPRGAY